jgi:hypothetical protein
MRTRPSPTSGSIPMAKSGPSDQIQRAWPPELACSVKIRPESYRT